MQQSSYANSRLFKYTPYLASNMVCDLTQNGFGVEIVPEGKRNTFVYNGFIVGTDALATAPNAKPNKIEPATTSHPLHPCCTCLRVWP